MAETDVLNPVRGYSPEFGFSPNPDFGYSRKTPQSVLSKKPVGGIPYDRDLINDGYSFPLSWTGRPWTCIQRVKRFYEQFKRGYFTFIDWEGGEREYVGRITTMPDETRVRNNVFSLSGVVFTEIPTCPMRTWPKDWEGDGVSLFPLNGFGDQDLATDGTWTNTVIPAGEGTVTMLNNAGTAGDQAQYEYLGYGFQLLMMRGPAYGLVDVYLDGVKLETVDLYAAVDYGPDAVHTETKVPRDFHRVKIVVTGNKNAAATAAGASWHSLKVIP